MGVGKRDSVYAKQNTANYMVVGELMLRKFGVEHKVMTVECFQGIKSEVLHRVIEKNYLGSS